MLGTQPRLCSGTSEVNPSYPQSEPAPVSVEHGAVRAGVAGPNTRKLTRCWGGCCCGPLLPQPLPQSGDNSNSSNNTMAAACNNAVTLFKETANQRYLYIYSPVL